MSLTAANDALLASVNSNVSVAAKIDLHMGASNDATLVAGKDMFLAAAGAAHTDADNIYITARSNVFIDALSQKVALTAAQDASFSAGGTGRFGASNGLYLASPALISASTAGPLTTASSTAALAAASTAALTAGSDLTLTAGSNVSLQAGKGLVVNAGTSSKQVFEIGGVPVLEIYRTAAFDPADDNNLTNYKVKINADFEIAGMTTNVNVFTTSLEVENKLINLAFNSNLGSPADGPVNDGAGIRIDGIPATDYAGSNVPVTEANAALYEKSLTWHKSVAGVPALGHDLSDPTTEAYWELKGGAFRLSQVVDTDMVTFCFRVNHRKELELWKSQVDPATLAPTEAWHFAGKRMAKFGRTF
jgi:hypothetical protein